MRYLLVILLLFVFVSCDTNTATRGNSTQPETSEDRPSGNSNRPDNPSQERSDQGTSEECPECGRRNCST